MSRSSRRDAEREVLQEAPLIVEPITWLCCQDWLWRYAPRWLDALCQRYLNWYLMYTLVPQMQRGEAAGVGCVDVWMPPQTDTATVTAWFERQVQDGPRTLAAFDRVFCYVFTCSPDEQATVRWDNIPPPEQLLGQWHGERRAWWSEGASVIAGLVPSDHTGLYLLVKRVSDLYRSTNQAA